MCIRDSYHTAPAPVAAPQPAAAPAAPAAPAPKADNLITIKSPMIGTFYRRASPDKPVLADVGTEISAGKVVCIIEAMKLFNRYCHVRRITSSSSCISSSSSSIQSVSSCSASSFSSRFCSNARLCAPVKRLTHAPRMQPAPQNTHKNTATATHVTRTKSRS